MAEQEKPAPDRADQKSDRQHDRDSASPREQREPAERASRGDMGESDAARRQARQDPLQHRDR